jgi:transposase
VVEVACWAHARRKFHEAQSADRRHSTQALAYIRLLYDVETQAWDQFQAQEDAAAGTARPKRTLAEIRLDLRQKLSLPRLAEFRKWLESLQATAGGLVLPKSPMGAAITYALNQWDALCVYTTAGELAIDNNVSENALRRIAVGRKNWLFCGSDNGGRTAAILFSLIASCQRHHVDPFAYLRDVLTRIAAHPHNRLAELLPDRWKPLA